MSGTPRGLRIDGLPYDLAHDCDLSDPVSRYENTMVMTSGDDDISQTKKEAAVGGVVIILRTGQRSVLKAVADSGRRDVRLQYTTAEGTTYKGKGNINIESRTTAQNRLTCSLMSVVDWTEVL